MNSKDCKLKDEFPGEDQGYEFTEVGLLLNGLLLILSLRVWLLIVTIVHIRDLVVVSLRGVLVLGVPLELHHLEIELLRALVINPECVKPQSEKKGDDSKESSQGDDDSHEYRVAYNLFNGLFRVWVAYKQYLILQ